LLLSPFQPIFSSLAPPSPRFRATSSAANGTRTTPRRGTCFKTAKAIRTFGNAGCRFDRQEDVPLSDRDRAKVREIEREERRNGCQG